MKKNLLMLLTCLLFFVIADYGHAATVAKPNPKLFLNGERIHSEVEPYIEKTATLVPLAILSKELGYQVKWDNKLKQATVIKHDKTIKLIINKQDVLVNGEVQKVTIPPRLHKEKTMVPLRFIGEIMGLSFKWDQKSREVHITSETAPKPSPPEVETKPDPGQSVENAASTISSIAWENNSLLVISYTGKLSPKTSYLKGTDNSADRLIIDMAGTNYSMKAANTVKLDSNPYIQGYRHSQFQEKPLMARVVADIHPNQTQYAVTQANNQLFIQFAAIGEEIPGNNSEVDPNEQLPTEPQPEEELPPITGGQVYTVVLDAGHGGTDPGASDSSKKRLEKDFNYNVTLLMKQILDQDGRINVQLSRPEDKKVELRERVAFAHRMKADLFISVHVNSHTASSANGSETYYYHERSKELANVMQKYLLAGTGLADRKVKKAGFLVIKETTMPAILLESGFVSNQHDADVLYNSENQQKIAAQLALGVKEYLKLN
ncbi:N-acetylmuramoyl-L-alanine amidase [Paenibacillus yanchengensis]|uniref:N-acetylmuramoyl-L-alanine amidase n=1 Tax=Paenibacillus yanchengensis TaxID=2035833 RepID=A0ABW4YK87_9BACL